MESYVAGFAFCGDHVALIKKNHPAWQDGKLNGIGGKIRPGEEPYVAMAREFAEEAGLLTSEQDWKFFCTLKDADDQRFMVHFFVAHLDAEMFRKIQTSESEVIVKMDYHFVESHPHVSNLLWLLEMARSYGKDEGLPFIIAELGRY
jgi:8-oxo-dGTP diphosphatase